MMQDMPPLPLFIGRGGVVPPISIIRPEKGAMTLGAARRATFKLPFRDSLRLGAKPVDCRECIGGSVRVLYRCGECARNNCAARGISGIRDNQIG